MSGPWADWDDPEEVLVDVAEARTPARAMAETRAILDVFGYGPEDWPFSRVRPGVRRMNGVLLCDDPEHEAGDCLDGDPCRQPFDVYAVRVEYVE